MFLLTNLEHHIFEVPYQNGYRTIRILSGYASSAFLTHILTRYPDLEIELIIGMARADGINRWDHERYREITANNDRIYISYQINLPGIHTKVYNWFDPYSNQMVTFLGSANFSWNGFRDQNEVLGEVNFRNVDEVFNVANTIDCNNPYVEDYINFYNIRYDRIFRGPYDQEGQLNIEAESGGNAVARTINDSDYVDLSLLQRDGTIHGKSGLNWGQRERREPNQAYIPVPVPFNNNNLDFFPPLQQVFTLLTDDGEQLLCKMAQQGRKAIETTENNSILGTYFRRRLGVALGQPVTLQDLLNYSRTSVRIYKIDSETYFMDFGIATPPLRGLW